MDNDLISRQAAIDFIKAHSYPVRYDRNSIEQGMTLTGIEQALKEVPSAQPKQKTGHWIKCSGRLPEDNIAVNITWANRAPASYYADIKDKPFVDTAVYYKGAWYWWSSIVQDLLAEYGIAEGWEIDGNIDVIAWMPLPEPLEVQ